MTRFTTFIFIALAAASSSGCSTFSSKDPNTVRFYDRPQQVVWDAVQETVRSTGQELVSANAESRTVLVRNASLFGGDPMAVFVDGAGNNKATRVVVNKAGEKQTNDFLSALSLRLPLQITQPMATAVDSKISAALDWVIIRNGPGTWLTDADWDQYIIRVRSLSAKPGDNVRVTGVAVFDSLATRVEPATYRGALIDGSKETKYRYQKSGITVKAGSSPGWLVAGGVTVGALGAGVAVGTALGSLGSGAASIGAGASLAAGGLLFGGVALVGVGISRAVDNSRINDEIERRQTLLPLTLTNGQESVMHIFFPLAPSPSRVEITYADAEGQHRLDIDTRTALAGMHLVPATVATK